jgi:uncharacterized iron-regulated membrane protein
MNRKLLVTTHLYLAAFFAPFVFLVSISGGLYLIGIKGELSREVIYSGPAAGLDIAAESLQADVADFLEAAGVSGYSFEYVKSSGNTVYTRPTSREHYILTLDGSGVEVVHALPSLQYRMIELHKGHGPTAFKTFQKFFSAGLVAIVGSGLWLGLSAAGLRRRTLSTSLAGTAVFLLFVLT